MSGARSELMRRTFERWNSGEREIDAENTHPDIVIRSALTSTDYHGYEGMRTWMAEIDDQFEDWRISIEQFRDVSENRVLVLGAVHFRGRTSRVEFDQPLGWLVTFTGERVSEVQILAGHAQALEAAGLQE